MSFEDFHIVANKEVSDRCAELLKRNGIRIHQRVISEIGLPEYVIAVHHEDLVQAEAAFREDFGPAREFTSDDI